MADTMRIADAIDSDLEHAINEIVKLGERDDAVVASEIGEYIVTADIERHFAKVLQRLARGMSPHGAPNVGFWVSGFYGSGKSSFVKILSFAIENPILRGRPASEIFVERTSGAHEVAGPLREIAGRKPVIIRFDLQGDRDLTAFDNEPFTAIAYRALRRALGYSESLRLSELEISLEEEGKLAEFTTLYDAAFGAGAWERQKHKEEPGLDNASRIRHEMDRRTYETPDSWAQKERAVHLTANNFPQRAAALVDRRRGPDRPFVFVADEVGHYIGRSGDRLQDVQGLVEALGRDLKGRAWLFTTAQERLDATVNATNRQLSQLPHLLDRFFPVDLAPKDIGEVAQRRLLRKTDQGRRTLTKYFADHKDALRTHVELRGAAAFVSNPDLVQLGETNFVEFYPFLPYQVDLVLRVVSGIRDQGGAHRLTGGAARTLIRLVQDILAQNRDIRLASRQMGDLATLDMVYDQQIANLPSERRTDIDTVVAAFRDDPLAIRVAKSLCMLEYADQRAGGAGETARALVPRTVDNLAAVLHPRVDAPSERDAVRGALARLEEKGKVRRAAAGYELLTPAAQKWEDERAHLRVARDDRVNDIRGTLKKILDDMSSWKHPRGRKFAADWVFEGRSLLSGSKDIRVELRRTNSERFEVVREAAEADTRADALLAVWVLAEGQEVEETADDLCRSEAMVLRYQDHAGAAFAKLLADERARAEDCQRGLRQKVQAALVGGALVLKGNHHSVLSFGASIEEAVRAILAQLVQTLFTEFDKAAVSADDRLIRTVLETPRLDTLPEVLRGSGDGIALLKEEANRWVVYRDGEVANYLLTALGAQGRRGQDVEQHFRRPPYGWTEDTVRLVLAVLLRGGLIQVTYRGRTLTTAAEPGAHEPFLGRAPFAAAVFARRDDALDNPKRVAASRALARMHGERVEPDEADIHRTIRVVADRERDGLVALGARLRSLGLPGADRVRGAQESLSVLAGQTAVEATRSLAASGEDLADTLEWATRLRRATTDEAVSRIREAREAVDRLWPALDEDGAGTPDLRGTAERLRAWLAGDAIFDHMSDLGGATAALARAYDDRRDRLLDARARVYHEAVEYLRSREVYDELARRDPERASLIAAPLTRLAAVPAAAQPRERPSLAALGADLAAADTLLRRALTEIEIAMAPPEEPPERIVVRRYISGAITDEHELSRRLEDLRDACVRVLRRKRRVILE